MRKPIALIIILLGVVIGASAQSKTYVGFGPSGIYSTAYDPSDKERKDGGQAFAGAHVEAGLDIGHNLQARALVEFQPKPSYNSIFTSDTDIGRKAHSELNIRAGLRYRFYGENPVRPFVEAGVQRFEQFFRPTRETEPLPDPLPPVSTAYNEYIEEDPGEYSASAGLNPYFTFGVELGDRHEASFSRLFEDQTSRSKLSGYRAGYSYTRPVSDHVSVKLGGELDYVTFRDSVGDYVALYYKRDAKGVIRFTLLFH